MKKIKAYIEIDNRKAKYKSEPTLWYKKPSKIEVENAREFFYEIYECEIIIGKKIK